MEHTLSILKNNEVIKQNTFNETMLQKFIAFMDVRERTAIEYTKILKYFFKYLADHNIQNPERIDILSYREYLSQDKKPSTVNNYLIPIRLFFQWAEVEGLYKNIVVNVKGKKVDRLHRKDALTVTEAKHILEAIDTDSIKGKRNYAILSLMITCGLRDIEVSRANIEDLRPLGNNNVLYVQGKGKDDKEDYVIVPDQVIKAIRDYLNTRESLEDNSPLFSTLSNNNLNGRMTTRAISQIAKDSMKAIGINDNRHTAHSLRHTAVTLALLQGNSLEEAQQLARHSNISTTQIYAHHIEKANNTCSRSVAEAIF